MYGIVKITEDLLSLIEIRKCGTIKITMNFNNC